VGLRLKLLVPLALTGAGLSAYLDWVWLPRLEADAAAEQVRVVERHLDSVAEGLIPLLLARQLDSIHENLNALRAKNDDWIAVRLTERGRQLYPLPGAPPPPARPGGSPRVMEKVVSLDREELARLAVTVDLAPGLAFGKHRNAELRWVLRAIFAAIVTASMVTLEVAVLRPIRKLARAAREVARQRFDSELPRPRRDEVGSLVRAFSTMRDDLASHHGKLIQEIAVRGKAELALTDLNRSLKEREAFFRVVLLNSPAITMVVDAHGAGRFVSTSAQNVLGWSEAELIRMRASDLVHPEDRAAAVEAFDRLTERRESSARITCRVRRKDGTYCVMDVVGGDLLDDPHVEGIVVNARDITAERLLQEQLLQAQKLESVGRLAGGVAHDFNNLLTVVLGSTQLLREDLAAAPAPQRELVQEIQEAGERARALTRQLLAFARREAVAPVPLDLGEVVAGSEQLLRRLLGERIELRLQVEPGLWLVRCDPGHLEQVIMNLAVNARDAMPDGGVLAIEAANLPAPPAGQGDRVRLVVRDSGVGMTPEVRARLFEPFFTTKPQGKGTGLGLATVYGIVTQVGGTISVASEPGRGATFEIVLPRHVDAGTAEAASPIPAHPVHAGTESVFVVEDDRAVRETSCRALRRAGYRVIEAADPAAALQIASDPRVGFDVLLVDVGLPGMKGTRLAEAIRRSRPEVPVLFVSGHIEETSVRTEVVELGRAFLPKPFTPSALLERIRALLDDRARSSAPGGRAAGQSSRR